MEPITSSSSSTTVAKDTSNTGDNSHHRHHHHRRSLSRDRHVEKHRLKSSRRSRSRSRSPRSKEHYRSSHRQHHHHHHRQHGNDHGAETDHKKHPKHHHRHHRSRSRSFSSSSSASAEPKQPANSVFIPTSTVTTTTGTVHRQPPTVPLTTDDFANKVIEFRYWLWYNYKNTRLFDLPKTTAQEIFRDHFIPQYNEGSLTDIYNTSTSVLLDKLEGIGRTKHKWSFTKTMNENDQLQLDTVKDTVQRQTLTMNTITNDQETMKGKNHSNKQQQQGLPANDKYRG